MAGIHGTGLQHVCAPWRLLGARLALACLLVTLWQPLAAAPEPLARIGVLAKRGPDQALAQWQATADYLGEAIPGYRFSIVPLAFAQIERAVAEQTVDFILTNPSIYVALERRYGITAIATMKNRRQGGGTYEQFGGVIFAPASRHDIASLADLRGKRFMAVDETSLGGWQMAWRELRRHGIEPAKAFASLAFSGTHDAAVYAVRDGTADAASVRTDTLERMAQEGQIDLGQFHILNRYDDQVVPFAHSTPLYPEWPFAKLMHTPRALAETLAVTLLSLPPDHPAASAARIAGWTVPLNYQPVHELLRELRLPPYDQPMLGITFGDILRRHAAWFAGGLGLLLLMAGASIYIARLNRRLRRSQCELREEIEVRSLVEEALAAHRDELEQRVVERTQELEQLHLYDPLTGLANRTLLYDRMDHAIHVARRTGGSLSLLMIDLNDFKDVNDTLGHYHGDLLLVDIAKRLAMVSREVDTLARLGGDEFAFILDADPDLTEELAERFGHVFEQPFRLGDVDISVAPSIGIAHYPMHGEDTDTLVRHADIAVYTAKRNKLPCQVYDVRLDLHTKERLTLAAKLKHAINANELRLHYQPKIELPSGRIIGLEALVRWQHPEMGLLMPDLFVAVAEQTGLVRPLTLWVLNAALEQCNAWQSQGIHMPVAVNLSALNLQDVRLVEQIKLLLEAWEVGRGCLELEVTETAMMLDPRLAQDSLNELHKAGIRIYVDDFGTGYSSLGYLQKLPVRGIKIDKSFVMKMIGNHDDAKIVHSIIELGHNLSMKVVAEGCEDQKTLCALQLMGCDIVQGYHVSRPMPAGKIAELLAGDPRWQCHAAQTTAG